MTGRGHGEDWDRVGRTLGGIALTLESTLPSNVRLCAALELLGQVVPYQQCALLEVEVGFGPRLLTCPAMEPEEESELTDALVKLFGRLLEERALPTEPTHLALAHLAVPLIALDDVIGVLFVRRREGSYEKRHLRVLSLVAAQLAAHIMRVRARSEEIGGARELQEARGAAESARRAKDELVGLIAHELKTPLEAALAVVQLLGSPATTADARARAAQTLERSVRTQSRLVSDLLTLSNAATTLELDLQPVEAAAALEAAIDYLRPLAERRSVRLEAALDASAGPVTADADRLDAVFAILLASALESTPDGGCVQIRLDAAEGGARIQVIDGGGGLAADRLSRLFESPRPEIGDTDAGQGGSGLAIAKRVVELHGGSIRAESAGQDQGTAFTVELPRSL